MDSNGLTALFIPAINLDDKIIFDDQATNLEIVNICSLVGRMC
jgi:hypothetical protein